MGGGILACEQALRGAMATGRKRKESLHLRHSCIDARLSKREEPNMLFIEGLLTKIL